MESVNTSMRWEGDSIIAQRCANYVDGTLPEDQVDALRILITSTQWFGLMQAKARLEAQKVKQAEADAKAKLIADCLQPLTDEQGAHELAMRQLRLLAAVLERL